MPTNEAHKIDGIASIFNNSKGKIVLLHGPWGSGKTYRFENTIRKQTKGKFCYVSLYEIASVDDLKAIVFKKGIEHALEERKWWSWQSLGIVFSIVYIFLMPAVLWGEYTYLKMLALAPPLIIAVLYWYNNLGGALSFLSSKYLGLNINACDIKRFLNPTDFSFCFDDFDRSKSELNGLLLGYFYRLAKEDGFNILVIDRSTTADKAMELGVEKVFDFDFKHDLCIQPWVLINLNSYPELEEALKSFYGNIQQMRMNANSFTDTTKAYLDVVFSNIRIAEKIINNIIRLNEKMSVRLDKYYVKNTDVLEYIILLTIAINIKCDEFLSSKEYMRSCRRKKEKGFNKKEEFEFLEDLCGWKSCIIYPNIYREILSGNVDVEDLKYELRDKSVCYTKFEKLCLKDNKMSYVHYSTKYLEDVIDMLEECIKQEKRIFSSLSQMKLTLNTYVGKICYVNRNSRCLKSLKMHLRNFAELNFNSIVDDENAKILIDLDEPDLTKSIIRYGNIINTMWSKSVIDAGIRYYSAKAKESKDNLEVYRSDDFKRRGNSRIEILLIQLNRDNSILQAVFDTKYNDAIKYTELMWRIRLNIIDIDNEIRRGSLFAPSFSYEELKRKLAIDVFEYAKIGIAEAKFKEEFNEFESYVNSHYVV